MATLVCFHAHPDDEAIGTGGTIARAAAEGHRVVIVFGTRGEFGEPPADVEQGLALARHRTEECLAAAELLGAARVEFLGYHDSGMAGDPRNDDPTSFWRADLAQAAGRLAQVLLEEQAEVLTVYDEVGWYSHPDHLQVHRVGLLAAFQAGTPHVFEATMDRDHVSEQIRLAREAEPETTTDGVPDLSEFQSMWIDPARITTRVDVRDFVAQKRAALAAHASQIPADSFFLAMPEPVFAESMGYEWYVRRGAPVGTRETWIFPPFRASGSGIDC